MTEHESRKRKQMDDLNETRKLFKEAGAALNQKFAQTGVELSYEKDPPKHEEWKVEYVESTPTFHPVKLTQPQIIDLGNVWVSAMSMGGTPTQILGQYTVLLAMQLMSLHETAPGKFETRHLLTHCPGHNEHSEIWEGIKKGAYPHIPVNVQKLASGRYRTREASYEPLHVLEGHHQACFFSYLAFCTIRAPFTNILGIFNNGERGQAKAIIKFFASHYKYPIPITGDDIHFTLANMEQLTQDLYLGSPYLSTIILSTLYSRDHGADKDNQKALYNFGFLTRANQSGIRTYAMFVKAVKAHHTDPGTMLTLIERVDSSPAVKYLEEFLLNYESKAGREAKKWWQWAHCLKREYLANFHARRNPTLLFLLACIQYRGIRTEPGDPRNIAAARELSELTKLEIMKDAESVVLSLGASSRALKDDELSKRLNKMKEHYDDAEFLKEIRHSQIAYNERIQAANPEGSRSIFHQYSSLPRPTTAYTEPSPSHTPIVPIVPEESPSEIATKRTRTQTPPPDHSTPMDTSEHEIGQRSYFK